MGTKDALWSELPKSEHIHEKKERYVDQVCLRRGRGKIEIIKKKNNQRFPREKKLVANIVCSLLTSYL